MEGLGFEAGLLLPTELTISDPKHAINMLLSSALIPTDLRRSDGMPVGIPSLSLLS